MTYTDGTHLVADSFEELHEFAQSIGLRRSWFQQKRYPHYDLLGRKKKEAMDAGAEMCTSRDILYLCQKMIDNDINQHELENEHSRKE